MTRPPHEFGRPWSEFVGRYVDRGGLRVLIATDALAFIDRCEELGIDLVSLDAFRLTETIVQPFMIDDLALADDDPGWAAAREHVKTRSDDFWWEILTVDDL